MITLTTAQENILNSRHTVIRWLFETSGYYWSQDDCTYDSQAYPAVVGTDFRGVSENRAKSELGIQTPNDIEFTIGNEGNALSESDFKTSDVFNSVTVRLVYIDDSGNTEQIRVWTFKITDVKDLHQRLTFKCKDYLSSFLEGQHPSTALVSDLIPTNNLPNDDLCVPAPYGTAYVPCRPVFIGNEGYYVLGPSAYTYTITEVKSPHNASGGQSIYLSTDYTFQQSTQVIDSVSYRVFQPLVHNPSRDGSTFVNALWRNGSTVLDILVKFTRSDTVSTRNFPDGAASVFQDFGIPAAMIDTASTFAALTTTHSTRSLTFDYGFHRKIDRSKRVASLANAYNATFRMTDKLEVHDLDRTSRLTLTDDHIQRVSEDGPSTFRAAAVLDNEYDSGRVSFPEADQPQDILVTAEIECVAGTSENRSTETLEVPYYTDSQKAGRAAQLYFQRKYYGSKKYTFDGVRSLLYLQPDDIITVNNARYGGSYTAIIDAVTINGDGWPSFTILKLKSALEDWGDNTPDAVNPVDPDLEDPIDTPGDGGSSEGAYPSNPGDLKAEAWLHGAKFSWNPNTFDDFVRFEYRTRLSESTQTTYSTWSSWANILKGEASQKFYFLSDAEITTHGEDAYIYIEVRAYNGTNYSVQTPDANTQVRYRSIKEMDVELLAVTNALINDLSAAKINTGYLSADRIEANTLSLSKLLGTAGTLAISSTGKIQINASEALEIGGSGSIKMLNGGHLRMYDGSSNELIRLGTDSGELGLFLYDTSLKQLAKYTGTGLHVYGGGDITIESTNIGGTQETAYLNFVNDDSDTVARMSALLGSDTLYIEPYADAVKDLNIGITTKRFADISLNARDELIGRAYYGSADYAYMQATSNGATSQLDFVSNSSGTVARLMLGGTSNAGKIRVTGDFKPYSGSFSIDQNLGSHECGYMAIGITPVSTTGILTDFGTNNSTSYYQMILNDEIGTNLLYVRNDGDTYVKGNITIGGNLTKGSGTFKIDHPIDPENKILYHGFIEGPRFDLIYRGAAKLSNGQVVVDIDSSSNMTKGTFGALTKNAVVVSLVNLDSYSRIRSGQIIDGKFTIYCEAATNENVSWVVMAERNDAHIKAIDITTATGELIPEHDKPAFDTNLLKPRIEETNDDSRVGKKVLKSIPEIYGKKGTYLHPEAFGKTNPTRETTYQWGAR